MVIVLYMLIADFYNKLFYASAIFNGGAGWGTYSITAVHLSCPYVPSVYMKNGFRLLSFKKIRILDSYYKHRYIIIKYMSSLI